MTTDRNNNSGCLSFFLPFLKKQPSLEDTETEYPYKLRDDFLSPAEFSFYQVLNSIVSKRLIVLCKVRLADIFFVSQPNLNLSYFNRIAQRHVDFLICRPDTMKPVVAIELDDSSHNSPSRRERDEFLDALFKAADFPLVHMPLHHQYSAHEINQRLSQIYNDGKAEIENTRENTQSPFSIQEKSNPLCPKCGIPMVLRKAKLGKNEGKQFYGCVNFPQCREIISIDGKNGN